MRFRWMPLVGLVTAMLMAGCSANTASSSAVTAVPSPALSQQSEQGEAIASGVVIARPEATQTSQALVWSADGIIGTNEYPHQTTISGVDIFWRNDTEYLYLAMRARTTAWVAIGFEPEQRMEGANLIMGAVVDGSATVSDEYGTGPATHDSDTSLGGTNDIIASAASLTDGVTLWEAQIPLDSGDPYDTALMPGQTVNVIVATGTDAHFGSPPSSQSSGMIQLS